MEKSIGRANECGIVILDPQNRVSRKHAVLKNEGSATYIKDEGSLNGTYVNGVKIPTGKYVQLKSSDKVTLSKDYVFDFNLYRTTFKNDETLVLSPTQNERTAVFERDRITVTDGDKTVMFDPNKSAIDDLSQLDNSPYKVIGRDAKNDFVVKETNVSRVHCRMRLLTPIIVELEDLGSSNGTFADGLKLQPGKKYKYSSSVSITLSNQYELNLKDVFPEINIIQKQGHRSSSSVAPASGSKKGPITEEEKAAYLELEEVWNEYNERNTQNSDLIGNISMGASAVGMAAMAFTPVPGLGMLVMQGIGLLGRYISQKKSNEIRSDLTYENMFLETYCCPRCKESFQKKPWVTIRDCNKCKLSFK